MGLSLGLCLGLSPAAEAGYETCYEQEYRCETRYEQSCSYENQCHTVPGHQECRQVRVCTPRPSEPNCQEVTECGRNALGEEICKTRKVCDGHTGGGEDCGYVQECSDTGSRQECTQERVCENVPREHCGYEQVAKQCYVPDPQPPYQPPPYQPPAPEPEPPYYPPTPAPEPEPPYYPPTPEPDPLPPTPPPIDEPDEEEDDDGSQIGPKSVLEVKLTIAKAKASVVTFKDKGQSLTYKTRYFISVIDKSGVVVVNQHATSDGRVQQTITLDRKLSADEDHTLVLRVLRSGGELVKDVSFVKTVFRPSEN